MANVKKNCNCNSGTGAYAIFKINTAYAKWGHIVGDIKDQEDLQEKLGEIEEQLSECFTVENVEGEGNIDIVQEGDKIKIQVKTTVFEQGEATDTWSIQHNLHKYPSVVLVDSAGTQFYAEVKYDSLDHVTIKINGATKGKAYLN